MSEMNVIPYDRSNLESDNLISGDHLFLSPFWEEVHKGKMQLLLVLKGDEPKAIFSLFEYSRLGMKVVIAPVLSPSCGLRLLSEPQKQFARNDQLKRICRALIDYLKSNYGSAMIHLAMPPEITDMQAFVNKGYKIDLSYTYRLSLESDENHILDNFNPTRRKNIRKAITKGFSAIIDDKRHEVVELIRDTLEGTEARSSIEFLQTALVGHRDDLFSILICDGREILAASVIGIDGGIAYYIAGGTSKDEADAGAFALFESIKEAKIRGAHTFDFCGSSNPEIERFFRGFGGTLLPAFFIAKGGKTLKAFKKIKHRFGY